jgi:hypothetical protein
MHLSAIINQLNIFSFAIILSQNFHKLSLNLPLSLVLRNKLINIWHLSAANQIKYCDIFGLQGWGALFNFRVHKYLLVLS